MAIEMSNAVCIKLVVIKHAFINAIDGIQKLIMIMNNIYDEERAP